MENINPLQFEQTFLDEDPDFLKTTVLPLDSYFNPIIGDFSSQLLVGTKDPDALIGDNKTINASMDGNTPEAARNNLTFLFGSDTLDATAAAGSGDLLVGDAYSVYFIAREI